MKVFKKIAIIILLSNIEINSLRNDNSQKFKFNEIKNLKGMDVSAHQKNINWEKVKKSDID